MQVKKVELTGKAARLRNTTLEGMCRFTRDSFVRNLELYVSPDSLSLYFPENKRLLKKCSGCGQYTSKLSILANFPPLCKNCVGELWYYSSLAVDPFNLKGKRVLDERDCKRIIDYIQTLRATSKAARTTAIMTAFKLLLKEEGEDL